MLRPRVWDLSLETFESQLRQLNIRNFLKLRLLGCWSRSQLGFPRSEPSERSKHLAHLQGCSCGHRCKRQQRCGGSRLDRGTWKHCLSWCISVECFWSQKMPWFEQRLERAWPVLVHCRGKAAVDANDIPSTATADWSSVNLYRKAGTNTWPIASRLHFAN